ncbi:hypothetical protein [Methylophilus sp. QUAN]|uniref:hypothetical protein n=1 Tax=Methylophilus sp. QUAN TaxID=2781020 RepID=UPI00188FE6EF|nr:hypothetical protein [Methylophilus sp. QUAN]MBF4991063.1 hypothetical protein [Methylophilus sp. QUAN]
MRVKDVVRYKISKVIPRSRLNNSQVMSLHSFERFEMEHGIRKLPCAAPYSPGDTLIRIKGAIFWSLWKEGIVRIDLYKMAKEILLEHNLYAGNIDFDDLLFP